MPQVLQLNKHKKTGRPSISKWVGGSFIATVVLVCTTFVNVIEVPVVSNYVGGTIFQITGYVHGLTTLYAPWLSKMMDESAGTSTATLLRVGSVVLVVLELVAIATLVLLALHLIYAAKGKVRPARLFGLLGYVLALVVPSLMFVVVRFVSWQMANERVELSVLSVPAGPRIQLVAAVAGFIFVLLATGKSEAASRQSTH